MKKSVLPFCSVFALCLLLASPSLAFQGAKQGLALWAEVVLPTLLPFMVCSNVVVALDGVHILIFPVKGLFHSLLRLSGPGSYVLVSGLLCGYPLGAKTCSEFLDQGKISLKEARYLLAISNHPSPMFLLGYVGACLPGNLPVWILLASIYLPILPLAFLASRRYGLGEPAWDLPGNRPGQLDFDGSLMESCQVMIKIGGYIMLFSILAAFISTIPFCPGFSHSFCYSFLKPVLLGIIEITTGIKALALALPGGVEAAGALMAGAAAFGGICGIFQTKSVIKNAGLSIRHYIIWKAVHSLLTFLLFLVLAHLALGQAPLGLLKVPGGWR